MVKHGQLSEELPTLGTASFYIMISIFLFLILHIFTGTKDTNSSKEGNWAKI